MADRQTSDSILSSVIAAVRAAAKGPIPARVEPHHSFIDDLGFDSMSIALLALALEDEFDQTILLHSWIARHMDPTSLTVASLCAYLGETMPDERAPIHP